MARRTKQLGGSRLDGIDGLLDVEGVDRDVAGVGHLLRSERLDVEPRVVGAKELRTRPDRRRTEPSSRPVRDTAVEGHAHDRNVAPVHLADAWEPGEGRRSSEPRYYGRVDGTSWRRVIRHGSSSSITSDRASGQTCHVGGGSVRGMPWTPSRLSGVCVAGAVGNLAVTRHTQCYGSAVCA